MKINFPKQVVHEFKSKIENLKAEGKNDVDIAEVLINTSMEALGNLRKWVEEDNFTGTADEIDFFKIIKPKIHSEFLFYHELFRIENKRKYSTIECQLECLHEELVGLQRFISQNQEFYHYYKRKLSNLDEKYFTRGNIELIQTLDNMNFQIDEKFTTGYDVILSKFMANEKLAEYLKSEIEKLEYIKTNGIPQKQKGENEFDLHFNKGTVALIELIYALDSSGAINNGQSCIKELAEAFEKIFNIKLGNYYRKFLEIRNRKTDKTKFLDELKQALINRMDDSDK